MKYLKMWIGMRVWTLLVLANFCLLAPIACTAIGAPANLATDCAAQAGLIQQATTNVAKLVTAERNAIDAQIALSKGYCSGTLPADQTAASKAVQASNAHIAAVVGVAALRK